MHLYRISMSQESVLPGLIFKMQNPFPTSLAAARQPGLPALWLCAGGWLRDRAAGSMVTRSGFTGPCHLKDM